MNLSVVIPTFNRRDSLRRTLDGLEAQTCPMSDFEVVVVSDGCSDGTDQMLASYDAPYQLRCLPQPNSGPSVARNKGVQEAQGDVIVFLDDDVEPVPEFLERHAGHHSGDDKVVVLGPMSPDIKNCQNEPIWIAWEHAKLQQTYDLFRPGGPYPTGEGGPMHFYSGNASVRRCWLEAVGGFDAAFTRQEDVELATRLAQSCGLHFYFDFAADGLHRPSRTWESWLRIPYAYGRLDAERVQAGQISLQEAVQAVRRRNTATRMLGGLCCAAPGLLPGITEHSRRLAVSLHHQGQTQPALAVLSGLYNTCYLVSFRQGIKRSLTSPLPAELLSDFPPLLSEGERPGAR